MVMTAEKKLTEQILKKTLELGADLAGMASIETLKNSPSHIIYGKLNHYRGVGSKEDVSVAPGKIAWPSGALSAAVIAVVHPEDKPELDWWQSELKGGTPGNRELRKISSGLSDWLEKEKGITAKKLPYHIESGGIFLKDAAALAGLGCFGKNNMFVSVKYGPRVRLRALLLNIELPSTGPVEFDPCLNCEMPCRAACPRHAFHARVYHREDYNIDGLPGRDGFFSRDLCNSQMEQDTSASGENKINMERRREPDVPVKYCRRCEFSCPVGKI
jgi:epoxyqueuosine reductase